MTLANIPVEARDPKVVREFKREVPCPFTGKRRGNCPGCQADHIIALCADGADHWSNMQWLTYADHKLKTRQDVKECRNLRRERKKVELLHRLGSVKDFVFMRVSEPVHDQFACCDAS